MTSRFPILLIDDDAFLLELIQQAAGTSFPEAVFDQITRVEEAKMYIASLDSVLPKLILLDINFKELLNGFDVLKWLRTNPKCALLPIIMLTSSESSSDVSTSYKQGASSFTLKPSSYEEWQEYLRILRLYWLQTVTLPPK